jgi:hypothetical protein
VGAKPDAKFGIFLSPDPIGPLNGGSTFGNRYAYVGYDPINFVDPTGHRVAEVSVQPQPIQDRGVDCRSPENSGLEHCQGGSIPIPLAVAAVAAGGLVYGGYVCFADGPCSEVAADGWDEVKSWGIWDGNFTGPKSPPKPRIAATSDEQMFGVAGSTGSSGGTTSASGGSGTPGSGVSGSSNPIPPPPGWLFGLNPPVAFQWQFAHDAWNVAAPETSTGDRVKSAVVLGVQFTPWGKIRGAFGGVAESFAASRSILARVGLVAGVDLGLPTAAQLLRPAGMTNAQFGRLIGWTRGGDLAGNLAKTQELIAELPGRVQALSQAGVTRQMAQQWVNFYRNVATQNPANPNALARSELMEALTRLLP